MVLAVTTSLTVFPAVRHARLTEAHAALLFGGRKLNPLHRLADGSVATDGVVALDGARGRLDLVRVVVPFVAASCVYVTGADADAAGFGALSTTLAKALGCTLSGPHGTVILTNGVLAAERVTLPARDGLPARVDVQIEGERPRLLRGWSVEVGPVAAVYVVDISGDLRPGTAATAL